MNSSQKPYTSFQSGYLLIEVLVTISLLAIGLLGVSAMLALSLKSSHAAIERGEIAMVMSSMAGRMRANTITSIATDQSYNVTNKAVPTASTPCALVANPTTSAQVAANDICLWVQDIKDVLGTAQSPTASISCNGNRVCSYTISWHDNPSKTLLENEYDEAHSEIDRSYSYQTTVVF